MLQGLLGTFKPLLNVKYVCKVEWTWELKYSQQNNLSEQHESYSEKNWLKSLF